MFQFLLLQNDYFGLYVCSHNTSWYWFWNKKMKISNEEGRMVFLKIGQLIVVVKTLPWKWRLRFLFSRMKKISEIRVRFGYIPPFFSVTPISSSIFVFGKKIWEIILYLSGAGVRPECGSQKLLVHHRISFSSPLSVTWGCCFLQMTAMIRLNWFTLLRLCEFIIWAGCS